VASRAEAVNSFDQGIFSAELLQNKYRKKRIHFCQDALGELGKEAPLGKGDDGTEPARSVGDVCCWSGVVGVDGNAAAAAAGDCGTAAALAT